MPWLEPWPYKGGGVYSCGRLVGQSAPKASTIYVIICHHIFVPQKALEKLPLPT